MLRLDCINYISEFERRGNNVYVHLESTAVHSSPDHPPSEMWEAVVHVWLHVWLYLSSSFIAGFSFSLTPTADCWRLWPQHGPVSHSDGAVGHYGCSPFHVQRPAHHQQWGPQHPAEQNGHRHQPGPDGHPGETHCEGDKPFSLITLFLSRWVYHMYSSSRSGIISLSFVPARRRMALKCSGALCQKTPAHWCSSVAVMTCPSATRLPSVNSNTLLAATRYVFKKSSKQPFRLRRIMYHFWSALLSSLWRSQVRILLKQYCPTHFFRWAATFKIWRNTSEQSQFMWSFKYECIKLSQNACKSWIN